MPCTLCYKVHGHCRTWLSASTHAVAKPDVSASRHPTPLHGVHAIEFENWTIQFRKGILELCVLTALAEGERYGYELAKTLVELPGLGVTEGTLYPLMSRLRRQGLVAARLEESSEGPARKYYSLTPQGHATLDLMRRHLDDVLVGLKRLRSGKGKP